MAKIIQKESNKFSEFDILYQLFCDTPLGCVLSFSYVCLKHLLPANSTVLDSFQKIENFYNQ